MSGMYDHPDILFLRKKWFRRFQNPLGIKHRSHKYLLKNITECTKFLSRYFHNYELAKSVYIHKNIQAREMFLPTPFTITEIGAGAGIVGVLALAEGNVSRYIDIDLKEMLPHAVATHGLFRNRSNMTLNDPMNLQSVNFFDSGNVPEIKFDVGINAVSFQEMDSEQVIEYMEYINRNIEPGGLFFSLQRDKKRDESRKLIFDESQIPWPSKLHTIHYEESIISRYNGDSIRIFLRVLRAEKLIIDA
jgi:hypothetical protein